MCFLLAKQRVLYFFSLGHQKGSGPQSDGGYYNEDRSASTQHAPGCYVALWSGWMEKRCVEMCEFEFRSQFSHAARSVLRFIVSLIHSGMNLYIQNLISLITDSVTIPYSLRVMCTHSQLKGAWLGTCVLICAIHRDKFQPSAYRMITSSVPAGHVSDLDKKIMEGKALKRCP